MIHPQLKIDIANELWKAAPPVAVNVAAIPHPLDALAQAASSGDKLQASGDPLQHWVLLGTLLYLGLQAAWLLWKWWVAYRTKGWTPKED